MSAEIKWLRMIWLTPETATVCRASSAESSASYSGSFFQHGKQDVHGFPPLKVKMRTAQRGDGSPITVKIVIWCMLPAAISVNGMLRSGAIQPLFLCTAKKKPLAVKKKTAKGGFASEQTPHSSSCPPQAADRRRPFRCSSFSHTNRFAGFAWEPGPFAIPLKRPRRGLRPPLLDLPRVWFVQVLFFGFTKRTKDAPLIDRRGYRNTLRLFRMHSVWQILR